MASGCRTALPPTLALFPAWGSSAGAGRTPLPRQRYQENAKCKVAYGEIIAEFSVILNSLF